MTQKIADGRFLAKKLICIPSPVVMYMYKEIGNAVGKRGAALCFPGNSERDYDV